MRLILLFGFIAIAESIGNQTGWVVAEVEEEALEIVGWLYFYALVLDLSDLFRKSS